MYESPIKMLMKEVRTEIDGEILKAVYEYGVFVDKDELLKALAYDRGQYDKGYADGQRYLCEWIVFKLEQALMKANNECFDYPYILKELIEEIEGGIE